MIEEELAKVKDRLAELQNAKKASRQMYDAACMRLGIANDLEAEEGPEQSVARPDPSGERASRQAPGPASV